MLGASLPFPLPLFGCFKEMFYKCQVDKEQILLALQCVIWAMLNYISQNLLPCISLLRVAQKGSCRWLEGWKWSNNYFVSCIYCCRSDSSGDWHEAADGPTSAASSLASSCNFSNSWDEVLVSAPWWRALPSAGLPPHHGQRQRGTACVSVHPPGALLRAYGFQIIFDLPTL